MSVDEMSRRFDELEKKVEERGDDMIDLIMRTSEIQSRPKKHDKVLEILEHQITDLQEKLNTCNEDKAKIEQDKLKAEALAKRMFDSYDKLSKNKEKDAVLMVAEKMDSVVAPAKALTAYMSTSKTSSEDNFISKLDGQHLIQVPHGSEQILTTNTIYLKQKSPPGFKKIGTLIDQQTDKTGMFEKTYYYFSENPETLHVGITNMYYDPRRQIDIHFDNIILPLILAEINKGVNCIKSCGLTSVMRFPPIDHLHRLDPDYNFKLLFYNYLNYLPILTKNFLPRNIETRLSKLTKSYDSISLENYNKLMATPGVIALPRFYHDRNGTWTERSGPANSYLTAYETTTTALVKALTDAEFPRYNSMVYLHEELKLWSLHSLYLVLPSPIIFEQSRRFIKCKIDFIKKMMILNRDLESKAGVGLGLKTKRKYTKYRKSHKRKQRRQHKRTKRQRDNNV